MGLKLGWVVIDADNPKSVARFWAQLLGAHVEDESEEFIELSLGAAQPRLAVMRVSDAKTSKSRIHLDLIAEDVDEEVSRAIRLGARRTDIGQDPEEQAVLIDPAGNEFCIVND